jgi:sugar phosphate isomerase/epimerase
MQIGAMNHPARDPLEEIHWIGEHGFDFVDFTLEPPAADPQQIDARAITAALAQYGLGVVAHTPWFIPVSSPLAGIRSATLTELRRCLVAAQAIGASTMNVHYRPIPRVFSAEQSIAWHVETLAPLCDLAAQAEITIVLEHVPEGGQRQLENIVEILHRVQRLGFHLDSGHAKLESSYDRFNDYVDILGNKIRHVHLSDNDGSSDQHLPLGAVGRLLTDWPGHIRRLKQSGYDETITLEVFAPCREYLLVSRDLLRNWWADADGSDPKSIT